MINFCKTIFIQISLLSSIFVLVNLSANAVENNPENLNIYEIQLDLLDHYNVIEKGTPFNLVLLNDVYARKSKKKDEVLFEEPIEDGSGYKISGSITMLSQAGRLSKSSSIGFSTSKLYLDDGQEVNLSAYSPVFTGVHPPHANTSAIGLAQTITRLSIAGGPITFGAGLGISFILSGLLSAYQNGLHDFFWGGLDGTGLSFVERVFRKQPELSLGSESLIPFILNDDLKISKGIHREKLESINLPNNEALEKIQQLLKRGDLTGALELSVKTGQTEQYKEIIKNISSL